jgi:hypothetical protein
VIRKEFLYVMLDVHTEAWPSACASGWMPSSLIQVLGKTVAVIWKRSVVSRVVEKEWKD